MVYLMLADKGEAVGVEQLTKIQKLSPTYLSKIFTKLVKAALIRVAAVIKDHDSFRVALLVAS